MPWGRRSSSYPSCQQRSPDRRKRLGLAPWSLSGLLGTFLERFPPFPLGSSHALGMLSPSSFHDGLGTFWVLRGSPSPCCHGLPPSTPLLWVFLRLSGRDRLL